MPSGRTHDQITLWSLPLVAALTFGQTSSSNLTLLVSGSFLFGGLMFGPDLDIYSCQYQRWGWFKAIWLPYQKSLRHRSFLSHGPLIGTALRILYLAIWIAVLGMLELAGCGFELRAIDLGTPHRNFSRLHRSRIGRYEPLSERLGRLGLQKIQKERIERVAPS